MAQLIKDPLAMQKTWVRSLGWEDPLEKGKATHSTILAWRIPWNVKSTGLQIVGHELSDLYFHFFILHKGPSFLQELLLTIKS